MPSEHMVTQCLLLIKENRMAKVYLSLGTNLGDKEKNLDTAIALIDERIGIVVLKSSYYLTEPWKMKTKNKFLNAALCIQTDLSPLSLLFSLQKIEKDMGRVKTLKKNSYEDRLIDIDILIYDNVKIQTYELTIPHPLMWERPFVLKPLAEIYPQLLDTK